VVYPAASSGESVRLNREVLRTRETTIKTAAIRVREEYLAALTPVRQAAPARQASVFENLPSEVREVRDRDVIDLDGFRLDPAQEVASGGMASAWISLGTSPENPEPMREVYIDKYRQTQKNSYYLNNGPTFEIEY